MVIKEPLISIIIPTYNRAHLLSETLDSVLFQTYSNWECIIVDDGSCDYTSELMDFYVVDNRIKFYRRPIEIEKGACNCRNYGYNLSIGELIMWLDDDDILHEDKLLLQKKMVNKNKNCLITCAWGRYSNESIFIIKNFPIYKDYDDAILLLSDYGSTNSFFPPHVFLSTRSLIDKSGFWRTDLSINDDAEFYCRIILNSDNIFFAKNTHVKYRFHNSERVSSLNTVTKAKDIMRSWKLIELLIPKDKRKYTREYINKGRSHAYTLLKIRGYRKEVFYNILYFYKYILRDLVKKIKMIII